MAEDLVCDGCGAMLALPDLQGRSTCTSCGRVNTGLVDASSSPRPAAEHEPRMTERIVVPTITMPPGTARKVGRGCAAGGLAVFIGVVVLVAGVVALVTMGVRSAQKQSSDRAAAFRYSPIGDDALILPGEGSAATEVVTLANDSGGGTSKRVLIRVELGSGRTPIWSTDPVPSDVYSASMVISGDDLFVGLGDQIWNLSARTGERKWIATLPDVLPPGCADCFQIVDGHLVVLARDATVSAFDPSSAESRWRYRLESPSGRMIAAGDRVVVLDQPTGESDARVVLLDPAAGTVLKTTTPNCPKTPDDRPVGLSTSDPLYAIQDSGDLVAVFGRGSSCVARFDPASGSTVWQADLPDGESGFDGDPLLTGKDLLYTSNGGGGGHIDLATGSMVPLEAVADLEIHPRALLDGLVLAETVTTRGSQRPGLGAWEVATGKRLWTVNVPGGAEPADRDFGSDALFEGSPASLLVVGGSTVRLVIFDGEARTVAVQAIDIRTGSLGSPISRPYRTRFASGIDSLSIIEATPEKLLVELSNMFQEVPLPDGDVIVWPEPA